MKFLYSLLIIFSLSASAQNAKMQLSGVISNNNADELFIKTTSNTKLQTLSIKNDKVSGMVDLPEGLYAMWIGNEYTSIYVANGTLNFTIDLDEFDESIKYTGSLSGENNYLASKMIGLESYKGERRMYMDRDENEFLDSLSTIYSNLDHNLSPTKLNENFKTQQLKLNRYERWLTMMMYPNYHPRLTKKESFKLSDHYYDFLVQIDLNDKNSAGTSEYIMLLNSYFDYRQNKLSKTKDFDDFLLSKLSLIRQQVRVPEIRDELVSMVYKVYLGQSKKSSELKKAFTETAGSPKLKKEIEDFALRLENLKKGNPAPSFSLENEKGEMKSLNDFKGKYVYLDIWATWCGPCKAELPHYEKLKEAYRGKKIEFISICVWDEKDAWIKFINDKKLEGTQLFNERSKDQITDNYMVEGVPHFVLIDKEGKLITHDAERPSDKALRERIDKLLNE